MGGPHPGKLSGSSPIQQGPLLLLWVRGGGPASLCQQATLGGREQSQAQRVMGSPGPGKLQVLFYCRHVKLYCIALMCLLVGR